MANVILSGIARGLSRFMVYCFWVEPDGRKCLQKQGIDWKNLNDEQKALWWMWVEFGEGLARDALDLLFDTL